MAVSKPMAELRRWQGMLNGFWQTSELAYGYLLSRGGDLGDADRPTVEALGHIESEVWYPNNQGRIKRSDTIGGTLNQVRANTIQVYRATLLSFFTVFEAYLEAQADHLKPSKVSWGEYVRSLSHDSLRLAQAPFHPLPLRVVLCADFCREVRNGMVHEAFTVPISVDAPCIEKWSERLERRASEAGWPKEDIATDVAYARNQVIGQAVNHVKEAGAQSKDLPIELFYMLFSFTNLDSLAFAIEEALQPFGSRPGGAIGRKRAAVRRTDLIVADGESPCG